MSKHTSAEKHTDFQDLVESIRSAEGESDRVKSEYESKVSELVKKGREKAVEMRESYEKKAEKARNDILSREREKNEKLAQETVSEAKKQIASLKGKKLDKDSIEAVFDDFVSSM